MSFLTDLYTIWKSRVNSATQKRARQVAEKAIYENLIEQGVLRTIVEEINIINASMQTHLVKYHGVKDIKLYQEPDEDEDEDAPAAPARVEPKQTEGVDILNLYRNRRGG